MCVSTNVDNMMALSRDEKVLEDTDEGSLTKYLGVDVKYKPKGHIELIQQFIDLLGLESENTYKIKPTPATKPLLHKDLKGENRKNNWNYRQAVGILTYLQATSRPDLSMAVHQCAQFSIKSMLTHERVVKRIGGYLLATKDKGIIFQPDSEKGLECFADGNSAGCR